jgi:choline transport protein
MSDLKDEKRRWSDDSDWSESDARDQGLLARLGKRPVMKRRFGFLTILGFTSTITCLWESTLLLMDQSLKK